ncbi:hypothetical protein LINGRAHAP2_LOCUS10331, partial [Linum grandiflorum]
MISFLVILVLNLKSLDFCFEFVSVCCQTQTEIKRKKR